MKPSMGVLEKPASALGPMRATDSIRLVTLPDPGRQPARPTKRGGLVEIVCDVVILSTLLTLVMTSTDFLFIFLVATFGILAIVLTRSSRHGPPRVAPAPPLDKLALRDLSRPRRSFRESGRSVEDREPGQRELSRPAPHARGEGGPRSSSSRYSRR